MVNYTWEFNSLVVKLVEASLTDVVYCVHWRLIGTDGEYSTNIYGSCSVAPPTPDSFIPYDQLTKEQVQGWVETTLGADQIAAFKDSMATQIELQKNPVEATLAPPWQNASL